MIEPGFYNLDCMNGMAQFPDKFFELAIVDVPYGIGEDGRKESSRIRTTEKWKNPAPPKYIVKQWDNSSPDKSYFKELMRVSKKQIIWGANHFISKIPYDSSGWIVWYKNGQTPNCDFSDCELAWTNFKKAVRYFAFPWTGFGAVNAKEIRIHPTQKPIALYKWLLSNYAKPGDKILDTHVGSASSLIACHQMGFEYWGFELDTDYYNAATKRLNKAKAQVDIFEAAELPKPEQIGIVEVEK